MHVLLKGFSKCTLPKVIKNMKILILSLFVFSTNFINGQLLFFPLESDSDKHITYPPECNCDFTYEEHDPVCGTNGITYTNPTYLYCSKKCINRDLTIAHKGPCKDDSTDIRIQIEHYNKIQAQATPKILNRCTCSASYEYIPVCGSNGVTYDNPTLLQCEKNCKYPKLSIARYGLCREDEYFKNELPFLLDAVKRCDCMYSDENDPVCGTDGYTYPNPSTMSCVMRCNNPSLRVVYYGSCRNDQMPHNFGAIKCKCRSTSEYYHPICADNGVTYDNLSLFYCAQQCLNRRLKILYESPCRNKLDIDERKVNREK